MKRRIASLVMAAAMGSASVFTANPVVMLAGEVSAPVMQASYVTVTSDYLNVRAGAGFDQAIVGKLDKGDTVRVLDRSTPDWYKIDYKGYQAYIYAPLTAAAGAPAASAPAPAASSVAGYVRVTSEFLNVRTGPGVDNNKIGELKEGQIVGYSAKEGEWWRISYNGQTAYIFSNFTTAASAPSGSAPAAAPAAPAAAAPTGAAPQVSSYRTYDEYLNAYYAYIGASRPATSAPAASAPAASAPAVAAPSAPPVASTAGGGSFEMGAHIKDPERLGEMKSNGMDWVKYQVVMPGGAPDLGGIIGTVRGAGMKILIGAIGDRGRANDTNYHREFAAALANVAKQGVDAIEVWNEPNLDREWGGSGANGVNPDNYANLLRESYNAIKAANPGVLVISGAPAPTGYAGGNCRGDVCDDKPFLERIARAGAAGYMDCQGAHYNGSPNPPNMRSGGPTGDHHSWYFWGTFDTTYNAIGKPICFTEMGYVTKDGISGSLPGGFSWGNNITQQNQAEWLGQLVTNLRSSGRARLAIVWNWNFRQYDDDPQAGYSILRPNGSCPACPYIKSAMGR